MRLMNKCKLYFSIHPTGEGDAVVPCRGDLGISGYRQLRTSLIVAPVRCSGAIGGAVVPLLPQKFRNVTEK